VIQLTTHMRILVAIEPADFRKGIDGLAEVCRARLDQDPFQGTVFVFRNRRATAIKILVYDGQGFWLCQTIDKTSCVPRNLLLTFRHGRRIQVSCTHRHR